MRTAKPLFAMLILAGAAGLSGCATSSTSATSHSPATMTAAAPATARETVTYPPVAASALAFDPPLALAQPLPDFSRDGRSPSAFLGYEESVTSVYSLYQRDRILSGPRGELDRQAYTGRVSVTTR